MPEFKYPEGTYKKRKRDIAGILWTLRLDGPFLDPISGRASSMLIEALAKRGIRLSSSNLNGLIKELVYDGANKGEYARINLQTNYIKRETRSKRTYELALAFNPNSTRPFPDCPFEDCRPMAEIEAEREVEQDVGELVDPEEIVIADDYDEDDEVPAVLREAMAKTGKDPLSRLRALTQLEQESASEDGDDDEEDVLPADIDARSEHDDDEYDIDALIAAAERGETEMSLVPVDSHGYDQNPQEAFLEGMRLLQAAYLGFSTMPVRDLDALIDQRLGHIASLNDKVQALEAENRKLKVDNKGLARALDLANKRATRLQGQLQKTTSGRPG